MTFVLKIKLGNAEMQTPFDIAHALKELAEFLSGLDDRMDPIEHELPRTAIRDVNGNRVGHWETYEGED